MLYCPKCQKTYEDAVQRFCLNDNVRLLPAPSSGKSVNQKSGVFTNFLKVKAAETDKFASAPGFSKVERSRFLQSNVQAPIIVSEFFKSEPKTEPKFEPITESIPETLSETLPEPLPEPVFETLSPIVEPLPKVIIQSEIPSGTAELDEKTNLKNRKNLIWENPQALIGQTIKGRYYVVEQIGADADNFTYLAEDKIVQNKKVVLRILTDDDAGDTFSNRIFDEERVALTHVNHPNIANVIDSGTLSEGNPFVLTEYIEGKSVKDYLQKTSQFDAARTAKIIRQASYALDEAHQNGVIHRNLKPSSIILSINEKGAEEVKLIDFGTPKGGLNEENLPYKSPEQVAGKLANFASDEFSLAVIAYQMLTDQLPFKGNSINALLKAQRENSKIQLTKLRSDLPSTVNEILQKALAFNPSDRYPRVRGFGEAFFNAFANNGLLDQKATEEVENVEENKIPEPATPLVFESKTNVEKNGAGKTLETISDKADLNASQEKLSNDSISVKSSPADAKEAPSRPLFAVLGVAILLLGLFGIWAFLLNRPNSIDPYVQKTAETVDASEQKTENTAPTSANKLPVENDLPPLPRSIAPPANTNYFQNSKDNFKGDAMRNFLGFSLYYPKDWKLKPINEEQNDNKTRSNFIDISRDAPSGTPIEQLMVSYYDSNGTFKADAEIFAEQVKETNETLKKIVPNYEMISEGEKTINNGWRAYEIKFQGTGKTAKGEKVTLWGKRLFIPTAIRGMKNGYVITMLATSLSKEITNVDDVGVKGELPNILETFEPNQNF